MRLRDDASLESFLATAAQETMLAALRQQPAQGGEAAIFLHGAIDTGKSHLLQAACQLAGPGGCYLPLRDLVLFPPDEVLEGLENRRLVCLDDIDAVLGRDDWEQALFHFYNRARARDCRLLISGNAAPRALAVGLPDLRSRLSWGVVFQLAVPGDEYKQAILQFLALRRGLQMPDEVSRLLVTRAPRRLRDLVDLLEKLDSSSLAEQRPLTVPFVKQVLGL
ncbi:DnaA regulatory inactivator Hda [Kineobactrum sediminis]|uniref:DnaA regulatory inactivator Hda n=2 Tax=Kineobactrum sediminis TaxID=1905677 RepID=A0A2N5Y0Z5_9GAMM|nr:DnaA regulatory inactivator Hda [Kineobactrum sediminis]